MNIDEANSFTVGISAENIFKSIFLLFNSLSTKYNRVHKEF